MPANILKIILLICLISTTSIFSQEDFITGQLLSAENGEAVVFATIRIKDKAIGVISNLDGSFRIPEKFKDLGSVLEISSLGYVTKDIQLFDLAIYRTNIIKLDPAVEILDEVVVRGVRKTLKKSEVGKKMSAFRIVERAIKDIPLNYSTTPFAAIGYYRDFQLDEKKYINLNEALFEVWDQGFGTLDHEATKVRIYEYKKNKDFPVDSLSERPYDYKSKSKIIPGAYLDAYGGNEFTILRIHDAIRNNSISAFNYVNVFKTDFLKNHLFKKEDEVVFGNEKLFNISFRKNMGSVRITGNLLISQENFAIHKLDYAMYGNHNRHVGKRKRTNKRRTKKILFETVVGYTPINGKMYPNYHSMKNSFNVKEPPRFEVTNAYYNLKKRDFVITLNNKVNENDALRRSNYKLKFKGKRIKIGRIVHIEDEVILYPDPKITASLVEEIALADKKDFIDGSIFNVEVKNLRDIDGNLINEPQYRQTKQYREFFVQRIIAKPEAAPVDDFYMNKNSPIFRNQPISRPSNFSDYWMNTPLPNIEE